MKCPLHDNKDLKVCNKNINPQLMFLRYADIQSITALLKAQHKIVKRKGMKQRKTKR